MSLHIVFLFLLLFFLKITPITPILTSISLIQNRIRKLHFMTAEYRVVNSTSHHRIPISKGLIASNGLIDHLEDEAKNLNKNAATKNGGQHDQNNQDEEEEEEEEADFNEESDDVSSCSGFISII